MDTDQKCYIPEINLTETIETLKSRKKDLIRYDEIMKMREDPYDLDFQRKYDAFYRVRRNEGWRVVYFDIMAKYLEISNPTFKEVLLELYHSTGQIEASFASKLLATINPDRPIWDSKVLSALRLKLDKDGSESRVEKTVNLYSRICEWYSCFLKTDMAAEWIEAFDCEFPVFKGLTSTKKIDFILWASDT